MATGGNVSRCRMYSRIVGGTFPLSVLVASVSGYLLWFVVLVSLCWCVSRAGSAYRLS